MKVLAALVVAVVAVAVYADKKDEIRVVTPRLDKAEIRAERDWQRENRDDEKRVSREWNWLEMNETDLFRHALPLLEANADLCGDRVLLVPVDDGETRVCDFLPYIESTPWPNAYTDGRSVYFTKGMLRAIRNADEFRAILGHEIGHVLAGHLRKKRRNAALGAIAGALVGAAAANQAGQTPGGMNVMMGDFMNLGAASALAFSKKYELEADYIGAYFNARAGGSVETAAGMWRRWGKGGKNTFLGSHPTESERFVLLRTTASEIAAKFDAGEPVVPNLKRETAKR